MTEGARRLGQIAASERAAPLCTIERVSSTHRGKGGSGKSQTIVDGTRSCAIVSYAKFAKSSAHASMPELMVFTTKNRVVGSFMIS